MPDPKNAKSIFLAAIEIESEQERREFVGKQCAGNQELAAEVNDLLENQPRDSYLESPVRPELMATQDVVQPGSPLREMVDMQIGPYKIRERIGEGGMGTVYVAEQEKPLRRKVALKLIKPGMDSKAVLGRFEAERNALALMNHPHIAKVLDAGTTGEGHPFFVMELVNGIPITEYCDEQKLSVRDRLQLFVDVCSAIQHAHQKGIIHRDIKPSNVLVTELDGKPIAKVIDFGVAKALNQSLTEHSVYTAFQTIIGTPLYMSPEQASFSAVDVDTRSDVYSLGVLLYELLTGTTPFTQDDLKQAAQDEVFKLLREQEPPRPSNRISSLGQTATRISQLRRSQPQQLTRSVQGDLDWIVMKALSKERSRRYDSATRLAEDVDRHLKNEVVEARPPSFLYQMRKFYRRNRQLATGVTTGILLLTTGLCVAVAATRRYESLYRELQTKQTELQQEKRKYEQLAVDSERIAQERKETLESLWDVLADNAMDAAFSGDVDAAETAIKQAESAFAPQDVTATLRAVSLLLSGGSVEAVNKLEHLVANNPDSQVAQAALLWAYSFAGMPGKHEMQKLTLSKIGEGGESESDDYTEFFSLLAEFIGGSNEALEKRIAEVSRLISRHRDWGAAYALRARIKQELAKSRQPIDGFQEAYRDFAIARQRLGNSLLVNDAGLYLLLDTIDLHESLGRDISGFISETHEIAESVIRSGQTSQALHHAARFHYLYGDPELGRELERRINAEESGTFVDSIENFRYRREAMPLDEWINTDNLEKSICVAMALAISDPDEQDRETIRSLIDGVAASGSPSFTVIVMDVANVLRDQAIRENLINTIRKLPTFENDWRWFRFAALYYAGKKDAEWLLNQAGPYKHDQCTAHYFLGMDALFFGNRDSAIEHFEAAKSARVVGHVGYHYAKLFLKKLGNGWHEENGSEIP